MGSVMYEEKCKNCNYSRAFADSYYKSNEIYVSCQRCGYSYSRTRKYDRKKSKLAYIEITEFLKENKIKEAWKKYGWKSTTYKNGKEFPTRHSIKRKIKNLKEIRDRIKQRKFQYYYLDGSKRSSYIEKEVFPIGAYKMGNEKGQSCGSYSDKRFIDELKKNIKENKKITKATYTFKENNKWYEMNLIKNKKRVITNE